REAGLLEHDLRGRGRGVEHLLGLRDDLRTDAVTGDDGQLHDARHRAPWLRRDLWGRAGHLVAPLRLPPSVVAATTHAITSRAAPMSDVATTPPSKATVAASRSASPTDPPISLAVLTAPASVSSAWLASDAGTPSGTTSVARYQAVRIPPRIEVPSTAPNSYAVSLIALAAPALSGGADEMMSSPDTVCAAPVPAPMKTNASTSIQTSCAPATATR